MKDRITWTVAQDGSGDFATLTEAVAACAAHPEQPVRFVVRRGIYAERPHIELADYQIVGEGRDATIITAAAGGFDPWPGEAKRGTFRSQTLFLGGQSAELYDITVQNTAGDGADAGQALAVYADAARVRMERVALYGNQDTLFTAPLPLQEREKNGFRGPREHAPRLPSVQYYKDCVIRGNVDFIFGGADAVFDRCLIQPRAHRSGISYIAAPCTPPDCAGYLFAQCTVQGNCPPHSVYLGRPWRANAAAYYLDCTLSDEICPAGWDPWGDAANTQTARFGESGCTGAGCAGPRAFGSVDAPALDGAARKRLAEFRAAFGAE